MADVINPNEVIWAVIVPDGKDWTFFGDPTESTKEPALENFFFRGGLGVVDEAYLCSFVRKNLGQKEWSVITCQQIVDEQTLGDDGGSRTFVMTPPIKLYTPPVDWCGTPREPKDDTLE